LRQLKKNRGGEQPSNEESSRPDTGKKADAKAPSGQYWETEPLPSKSSTGAGGTTSSSSKSSTGTWETEPLPSKSSTGTWGTYPPSYSGLYSWEL